MERSSLTAAPHCSKCRQPPRARGALAAATRGASRALLLVRTWTNRSVGLESEMTLVVTSDEAAAFDADAPAPVFVSKRERVPLKLPKRPAATDETEQIDASAFSAGLRVQQRKPMVGLQIVAPASINYMQNSVYF